MGELEGCLLSREENVTELDSISACTAEVKESIENGWAKLETDYRAEIKDPAVLITGGWDTGRSAEIYHPDRDSACVLPDLPDGRWDHTQDVSLLCGGWERPKSCRRWNTGAWDLVTESLRESRASHTSWTT